jgi:thioredoxin-like negative regulator of GroEL
MDTDEGAEMAERYGIKSVPTIIALDDDGVEIGRDYGSLEWKSVECWLTQESLKKDESDRN